MPLPDRDNLADALAAMSGEPDSDPQEAAPLEVESVTDERIEPVTAPSQSAHPTTVFQGAGGALRVPRSPTDAVMRGRTSMTGDAMELKRTLIPILLTCGALLLAGAGLSLAGVITGWAMWVPIVMIATGLILLGLAALNMLHVRDRMRT